MVIDKQGVPLTTLDEWRVRAPPKGKDAHWHDKFSAKETARAWLEGGGTTLPTEVSAALAAHPHFGPVSQWKAQPEVRLRFDDARGEPRNTDLLVQATDAHGPYVIAVEAKVEESFSTTMTATLAAAHKALSQNPRSEAVQRIEHLLQALLGVTLPMSPVVSALRYQLFTACAGALAVATQQRVPRAVMLVQEFVKPGAPSTQRTRNGADLNAFVRCLSGGSVTGVAAGEIVGPFTVPGSPRISSGVQLYLGKVTRDLRA